MKTATNGDVVVLVRVTPNANAEYQFMKSLDDIREAINFTKIACQLQTSFGWETPDGQPYNQYELDFDSEEWLWYGYEFLENWFDKADFCDDMIPQVVAARRNVE